MAQFLVIAIVVFILWALWKLLAFLAEGLGGALSNMSAQIVGLLGPVGAFIAFSVVVVLLIVWLIRRSFKAEEERKQIVARQEQAREAAREAREEEEKTKVAARLDIERKCEQCRNNMTDACFKVADQHRHTLLKKYSQMLTKDDYGIQQGLDRWNEEVSYFVENVALQESSIVENIFRHSELKEELETIDKPNMAQEQRDEIRALSHQNDIMFLRLLVQNWIEILSQEKNEKFREIDFATMSGAMFEIFCQETLENSGWSVVRKGGSGDQGVDLIAKREGVVVAIQCKRYSKPVGNKAVQEVEAGRQFEQAHRAIVVSTADYTPAARQLASSLGVLLLHHEDLERLHEVVAL